MKFIFPQNYCFKNKLFGFLDYSTAIFNIIFYIIIFLILNLFKLSFTLKISCFIIICLPIFLFSIVGFNHENILYVSLYIIKFLMNRKIYFFLKY